MIASKENVQAQQKYCSRYRKAIEPAKEDGLLAKDNVTR